MSFSNLFRAANTAKWAGVRAPGSKSTTSCHPSAIALVLLENHLVSEHLQQREEKLTGSPVTPAWHSSRAWDLELGLQKEEVVYPLVRLRTAEGCRKKTYKRKEK